MHPPAVAEGFKVAVLLPCRNEAGRIGAIVAGFARALPDARIYVFDNNSTDDTAREAALAGARVLREARPGKESVVRRMFADVDADIYLMAEGGGSCDPTDAPSLVNALITERVDMVVGRRCGAHDRGSRALEHLHRRVSGGTDIFSGYRAFTRRFVKSFPAIPTGLGIEAEMSMHASQLMIPVAEIDLSPGAQSPGAQRTGPASRKGMLRSLARLAKLARETQPFHFYAALGALFWTAGLAAIAPHVGSTTAAGSTILAIGLFVIGFILAACGLILESLRRSRVEQKRILFLSVPALGAQ
jgi:hypothetical protein